MNRLYFSLFFLIFYVGKAFAQPPANDSCSHSEAIAIGFTTQWQVANLEGANGETGPQYANNTACIGFHPSSRDAWFEFNPTHTRALVKFQSSQSNFYVQILSGNCQLFTPLSCKFYGTAQQNLIDSVTVGPLVPGSTYYVRILRLTAAPVGNAPYQFSVQNLDVPNILRSKVTGGLWSLASTWEAGIVPVSGDSVIISESSTVTQDYSPYLEPELAWIAIGGEDSTKTARLHAFQVFSKGEIMIGKKDTVYGRNDGGVSKKLGFQVYRNLRNDGGIRSDIVKLYFQGKGMAKQRFYGSGGLRYRFCSELFADNPGGVDVEFPLMLMDELFLMRGVVDFKKPTLFYVGQGGSTIFGDTTNRITRFLGKIEGNFGFLITSGFVNTPSRLNFVYGLQNIGHFPEYKNLTDTSRSFGKEYYGLMPERNGVSQYIKSWQGWKQTNGNTQYLGLQIDGRWLGTGPRDTIFGGLVTGYTGDTANSGFENVVVCTKGTPGFEARLPYSGYVVTLRRNGKVVNGALGADPNYPVPLSMQICYDIVPQKPTGAFQAPIKKLFGQGIFKVSSNEPLPNNTLDMNMYYSNKDSIVGNPYDIRLCQGPTPNGPWKVISDSIATSSDVNNKRRRSRPITWADGQYFCWASTAVDDDMGFFKLLPPPAYGMGCPGAAFQRVGLVVKNLGVMRVSSYQASYQFENQEIRSIHVTYPPGQELQPLKMDTLYLEGPNGLTLPNLGMWNYKAWVTMTGDPKPENDTLAGKVNYLPRPFPYRVNFDSIPFTYQGDPLTGQSYPNLPYQWYDSLRTEKILARSNDWENIFQMQIGDASENHILVSKRRKTGKQQVYTGHVGPITSPAIWQFSYRIARPGDLDSARLRPGDTLYFEGSDDCGVTWKRLWTLHRGNQVFTRKFQRAADSLPFPAGSTVVFRLTEEARTGTQVHNYPSITLDSLWIKPGVIVIGNEKRIVPPASYTISPNPAHSILQIHAPEGESVLKVAIFDAQGRQQPIHKTKDNLLNIKGLPSGIYTIRIQGITKQATLRFVKE